MWHFCTGPDADPQTKGRIWAAALWDLRTELKRSEDDGARKCDLLVLKILLSLGQIEADGAREVRRAGAAAGARRLLAGLGYLAGSRQGFVFGEASFAHPRVLLASKNLLAVHERR